VPYIRRRPSHSSIFVIICNYASLIICDITLASSSSSHNFEEDFNKLNLKSISFLLYSTSDSLTFAFVCHLVHYSLSPLSLMGVVFVRFAQAERRYSLSPVIQSRDPVAAENSITFPVTQSLFDSISELPFACPANYTKIFGVKWPAKPISSV